MATTTNKTWQKDDDTTAIDQDAFINAFLDDLDASLFGIGANSAKPGSPDEGDTFYDTDASRFIKYNGSAWVQVMPDADNVIDSDHYVDGSIDTAHLAADVVTGAKIADDALDSEHYTDGSIDTAHLAADAVTAAKIGDDVIDSEHYVDGSIDTAHLAADAVTGAKIADDALDSEHYTDGSIDTAHLAADAVTGAKIADDAIDSEHYADGSIDNAHIADDAIDSEHYADGSIDNAHIADDAIDSEHYADGSIDNAHIADDAIDSEHYADGSIDTAHLADDAVTLAKTAAGTQGGIQYYAASGAPAELAAGTSGYFLKTQGASANPVWAAGGGGKIDAVSFVAGLSGNTTSTSYADVSGGEIAITTDKGGLIAWYAVSGYNSDTSANNYWGLQLDSATEVAVSQVTQNLSNQDYVYSGMYVWTSVSDAAHEINVRFKVSAGTINIRQGTLIVMEFDD